MKLRRVNPTAIKVPEVRVKAQFDEELLKQFQDSIKAVGQISPIICFEVEEELVLCDGEHRLQEALNSGKKEIDTIVIPGDMVDVLTRNIFLDHLRGKTSVSQMVKVIKTLGEDYGLDPDQIAERTFKNREYVEKLLKIGRASSVVQDALDQGWIGVGVAFEISRLPYAIQQEEIIAKQRVYGFTVPDTKALIDKTLQEMQLMAEAGPPQAVTTPRPVATYHCEGCKGEVEPRYLRPVMLCPNCFGEVWRLAKTRPAPEMEKAAETPPP